ncbi:hypothetical protein E2C01_081625 [Portunus trituberculatus]|uniref:Uncharacterized protein n=1 Tax=Portunus trituberculatus TaxID=210409 RepID=A0A5B7J1M7_PORTR|nr:hypothetical protein [Portunus trituberculatus]
MDVTAGRGCDLQEAWPGRGEGEGRTAALCWGGEEGKAMGVSWRMEWVNKGRVAASPSRTQRGKEDNRSLTVPARVSAFASRISTSPALPTPAEQQEAPRPAPG